jgi:hypothetical protein
LQAKGLAGTNGGAFFFSPFLNAGEEDADAAE